MIIISGTALSEADFPLSKVLTYELVVNTAKLRIKLRTVAESHNCTSVYLHSDLEDKVDVSDRVKSKIQYFTDDKDLLMRLKNDNDQGKLEEVEPEFTAKAKPEVQLSEKVSRLTISKPDPSRRTVVQPQPQQKGLRIAQKDISVPKTFANQGVSRIKNSTEFELDLRLREIEELKKDLRETLNTQDTMFKAQEYAMLNQTKQHDEEIAKANKTIEDMASLIESMKLTEDHEKFLQLAPYAYTPSAVLNTGFTGEEIARLGQLKSNLTVIACGNGESLYDMQESVAGLLEKASNTLVVDFTFDYYFCNLLNFDQNKVSSSELNTSRNPEDLCFEVGDNKFIPTAFHHDISLLGMDWINVIKKLDKLANGGEIVIMLGSLASFSVMYTLSKLTAIAKMLVFANSNPSILATLYGQIQYLDSEYVTVVATKYFDGLQELADSLADTYNVYAVPEGASVDWDSIFK